jgi:hypothetical protein
MVNKGRKKNEAGGGTNLQGRIARGQVARCKFQSQTSDLDPDKETGGFGGSQWAVETGQWTDSVGSVQWNRRQALETGPVQWWVVRPSWCTSVGMDD